MAESLADMLANEPLPRPARAKRNRHQSHETPHVKGTADEGEAVAPPRPDGEANDYVDLLRSCGLDPAVYEVIEPVRFNRWQRYDGEWLRQDKFAYRRRGLVKTDRDFDALVKRVSRHRSKPKESKTADTMVVAIADTQAGKGEGGGSEALVERWLSAQDAVTALLRERRPDHLVVAGMGDLVEGCTGHYDMQAFQADLDRRQQGKLVRRMLVKNLTSWAPLVPRVTVACVPGNHGENRKNGKAYTTFGDNDDVAVFEQVKEILAANPESYGHVRFAIPDDELVVTLEVGDTIIALAHGHQFRRGSNPQAKAEAWWSGQAMGNRPAGDASVLVSGHYHHLTVAEMGEDRLWLQCPSLDGGSAWFAQTSGKSSRPGLLTFMLGESGVDDIKVVQ